MAILPGCNGDSDSDSYPATIEEGRKAALEMLNSTETSSVSVAFVANSRLVWAETFASKDKEGMQNPTTETMYCIGSVSKMITTIAAMQLVDQGLISLDGPVTDYLPQFSMLSPEFTKVTVRMLLNHTSGFPGTDYRNSETSTPYSGYADQVQQALSEEYLKVEPGFMATYCNDGFTLVRNIIYIVTGKTFSDYVQQEILEPLGMNHSRYSLEIFASGTYAENYIGDEKAPFLSANPYASGGLYSTPSDMSRLARMLLNGGELDGVRILSNSSVEAMASDQIKNTFNPLPSDMMQFGLGWDTVSAPGLKAVGVHGLSKGGDISYYGTSFILAPDQGLAAIVSGTAGFSSTEGKVVAQRILLRALVEQGFIDSFPEPLPAVVRPERTPTQEELDSICGYWGTSGSIFSFKCEADDSLSMEMFDGSSWSQVSSGLKMRNNDWFSSSNAPFTQFSSLEAGGKTYLGQKLTSGHYTVDFLNAQKIFSVGPLSNSWQTRMDKTWLVVNMPWDELPESSDPRLSLVEPSGLEGLIATNIGGALNILNPGEDNLASIMLVLPQGGRDLNDLFVIAKDNEEWLRVGSSIYRPLSSVPVMSAPGGEVEIGTEGYARWRAVKGSENSQKINVSSSSAWKVRNSDFSLLYEHQGAGETVLSPTSGNYYFIFYGQPGEKISVLIDD